ncbi:type IV pilus modification protein PilV [Psychrobacter sp. DAB_AL43B]|uniref:type IV pilus modification protein PilV n=1 Tax=Psychrobacter sp. DAB_AL43B TaxID=1028416 RepID=UPI0009C1DA3E|nr:type IV pilus modification protein PilV [Psychrobacter sp. DAB_AL43B]SLJ83529.1 type IV fimbrial biogenesis protein PilV [Psychrobacter sp. DAB_AL43B]
MLMKHVSSQHGVGLVEVLVAVLLLSIAVLGFSALQVRAVSATDESLVRTKSLTLVRNLAEIMRAYPEAYVTGGGSTFVSVSPGTALAIPTIQAIITSTATDNIKIDTKTISRNGTDNCLSNGTTTDVNGKKIPNNLCNISQLATRDALMVKQLAKDEGVEIAVVTCPGTTTQAIQQQMCIVTAWNDTKALLDDADDKACAGANGVYKTGSQCLISEAY